MPQENSEWFSAVGEDRNTGNGFKKYECIPCETRCGAILSHVQAHKAKQLAKIGAWESRNNLKTYRSIEHFHNEIARVIGFTN